MSKTVIPVIARFVQFNTTIPFEDVIARLDTEVNKAASRDTILAKISLVKNQEQLKSAVEKAAGTDFLCEVLLFPLEREASSTQTADTSWKFSTTSC